VSDAWLLLIKENKYNMKKLIYFSLLSFFISCNNDTSVQRAIETKIITAVSKIDKVVERNLIVQSNSKGQRSLEFMIISRPSENQYGKYWVKVFEDNGVNLIPHFNFLVESDKMQIFFLHTTTDSLISLKEWQNPNGIDE
jgi:hypothetical protein